MKNKLFMFLSAIVLIGFSIIPGNANKMTCKKIISENASPKVLADRFLKETTEDAFILDEKKQADLTTCYMHAEISDSFLLYILKKNNKIDLIDKFNKKEITKEEIIEFVKNDKTSFGDEYSSDWFSNNMNMWSEILKDYGFCSPEKTLKCLEIGSWEGRSASFISEKLLTNKNSVLYCLDTFQGSMEHENEEHNKNLFSIFSYNLLRTGKSDQIKILKGESRKSLQFLLTTEKGTFDFAYIDGSHTANDVFMDAMLVYPLIKNGGLIFFDDYEWAFYKDPLLCPKLGIETFLHIMGDRVKIIKKDYQLYIQKIK